MPSVETVTVLITDLVGSTGLASRLGPAAAEQLRREHFAVLREAIQAHGGDELKNTGDGMVVVFQGAADAVECAVSIQHRILCNEFLERTFPGLLCAGQTVCQQVGRD